MLKAKEWTSVWSRFYQRGDNPNLVIFTFAGVGG